MLSTDLFALLLVMLSKDLTQERDFLLFLAPPQVSLILLFLSTCLDKFGQQSHQWGPYTLSPTFL